MKLVLSLVASVLLCTFVISQNHPSKLSDDIDKPTESWLMHRHEVITNPDGVVRSKGHA